MPQLQYPFHMLLKYKLDYLTVKTKVWLSNRLNIFRWYLHFKRGSYLLKSQNIIPRRYFWAEPFWCSVSVTSISNPHKEEQHKNRFINFPTDFWSLQRRGWQPLTQIWNKIPKGQTSRDKMWYNGKSLATDIRWTWVLIAMPALSNCTSLAMLLDCFESQFPYLK